MTKLVVGLSISASDLAISIAIKYHFPCFSVLKKRPC